MASLTVNFSGPSGASNDIEQIPGTGFYVGAAPDFAGVSASPGNNDYTLLINNPGGAISGWPTTFIMTKNDSDPSNVIGNYEGAGGTAVVGPL